MNFRDHFSGVAPAYAAFRPGYPASLFDWFSGEPFFAELRRVLAPRGLFAAWTYGLPSVEDDPVGDAIERFGTEVLGNFWPPEVRHVLGGYAEIEFPPGEIAVPSFEMMVQWTLPELLGFVRSWSGVAAYREERGEDPVELLGEELAQLWTDAEVARRVSWPLAVRAARV